MGTFETIEAGGATRRVYRTGDVPEAAGVVVFHPWSGRLNDDVVAYSDRLAASGFAVLAPDPFEGQVASTIADGQPAWSGAADEAAIDAIARRRRWPGVPPGPEAGRMGLRAHTRAMWTPAERDRLAASVVYYGDERWSSGRARVPVARSLAETDPTRPDEGVAELRGNAPARRVVTSSSHRYPGRGTGSPSRRATPRAAAADLAFERSVTFLGRQIATPRADDAVTASRSAPSSKKRG